MKKILSFYLFMATLSSWCHAQPEKQVPTLINLQPHWLVYQDGRYQPYRYQSSNAIYFWLKLGNDPQKVLHIRARHLFSFYVNQQLVFQKNGDVIISIDSLRHHFSTPLFCGIYSANGVYHIQTFVTDHLPEYDLELLKRKKTYFLDFSIIATILLMACFSIFMRTNPTLTLDYLNLKKLFYFQDKGESKFTLRVASSVNLLFYLFGSFFLALILMITFRLAGNQFWLSQQLQVNSIEQAFGLWLGFSIVIFFIFILKLVWLAFLTLLFGFRDTVNFQFFNFVRMVFWAVSAIAFFCVCFFIFKVQQNSYFEILIFVLVGMFVVTTVVTYFKLLKRMPFHFFHLFFYLCASEIIPLLVLIRVFFY